MVILESQGHWASSGLYILRPTYLEIPEDAITTMSIMRLTTPYADGDDRNDLESVVSRSDTRGVTQAVYHQFKEELRLGSKAFSFFHRPRLETIEQTTLCANWILRRHVARLYGPHR
jgi:hypothetical protein